MTVGSAQFRLSTVVFDDFELLDVFGPLEMFGRISNQFALSLLGASAGPVQSAQGPTVVADCAYVDAAPCDIVLVPGGRGTRRLVENESFLAWLSSWASSAQYVASVCTGSGVLAAAGLLDGYRATSNKRAFTWASNQGIRTEWVPEARWVEDRNRWTSSGVAAGIDMALALIATLIGEDHATNLANTVEYEWHKDSGWDPFAELNGLRSAPVVAPPNLLR